MVEPETHGDDLLAYFVSMWGPDYVQGNPMSGADVVESLGHWMPDVLEHLGDTYGTRECENPDCAGHDQEYFQNLGPEVVELPTVAMVQLEDGSWWCPRCVDEDLEDPNHVPDR